jgi:hypothetical protein
MAEELLDAVARATNIPVSFTVRGVTGTTTGAMKLPDPLELRNNPNGRFLDQFGRGNRDDVPRTSDTSISQSLAMMNDLEVLIVRTRKTTNNSTVNRVLSASADPSVIADQLYVATLSRHPTAAEKQAAVAYIAGGNLTQRTEDLQWALLNTLEFLFN